MKTQPLLILLSAGAIGALGAGCGSDLECGAGTVEKDGACVPAESACAAGTTYSDGECVPDGSVICETGTIYDPGTGACVPDDDACAEGTVLINGQCVPEDDTLVADVTEPAEPNGINADDVPGEFTVPAEGDFVTLGGCINPFEDIDENGEVDADLDAFAFTVTEPTLLDISVDGLHGLAGGFVIFAGDEQLNADGWQRFGVNLVSDTSRRQVFIPKAGTYLLTVGDSRSFFLSSAGGPDACYYTTVATVPIPEPTALAAGTVDGVLGDAVFYSTDPVEGAVLFSSLDAPSASAQGAITLLVNGEYVKSTPFGAEGDPAAVQHADLSDDDEVLFVVDSTKNYALTDVAYQFDLFVPQVAAAPADGSSVTLTNSGADPEWLYFDAAAGDVVNLDLSVAGSAAGVDLKLGTSALTLISDLCPASAPCTSFQGTVQISEAGRYYLSVADTSDPQEATIDVSLTRTEIQPTALTLGTPIDDVALSDGGVDYYTVDASASDWVGYFGNPTAFGGDMSVELFDRAASGQLGVDVVPDDTFVFDGSAAIERPYLGTGKSFLVRVSDTSPTAGATYDFSASERTFVDLTVDASTPATETGTALAADTPNFYVVHGTTATVLTFAATGEPGTDLAVTKVGQLTTNATGDSGTETVKTLMDAAATVAFVVADVNGAAGAYDLNITEGPAPSYTVTEGTLAFTSVCPGNGGAGQVHTMKSDGGFFGSPEDEGISQTPITLGFGFDLFGSPVTEITVSTNGWITGVADYAGLARFINDSFPTVGAPDGVIAPFWADIRDVQVCVLQAGDSLTVEWTGDNYEDDLAAEYQVVLHDTGVIDFIYGPNQATTSAASSIGIEGVAGVLGEEISFNAPGAGVAGTSYTLTPDP